MKTTTMTSLEVKKGSSTRFCFRCNDAKVDCQTGKKVEG